MNEKLIKKCLTVVENKFILTLLIMKRARQLIKGGKPLIDLKKESAQAAVLNEIYDKYVKPNFLEQN